jgi:hypothetical protein
MTENLKPGEVHLLTIAELADNAFLKAEHLRALNMVNTPTDFEERRKAFIELAEARAAAADAHNALEAAIHTRHLVKPPGGAA